MTAPLSNRFDSVASAGASTGAAGLVPIVTIRSPLPQDIVGPNGPYRISQEWINTVANASFVLTSLSSLGGQITANWAEASNRSSFLETLTGDSGVATAVAGNINTFGTANEITSTGSGSTLTLSIPSAFIAPGSIASTTTVTAGTGLTVSTGNLLVSSGTVTASGDITTSSGDLVASAGAVSATSDIHTTGGDIYTGSGDIIAQAGDLVATLGSLQLNGAASRVLINAGTTASACTGITAAMTDSPFGSVTVTTSACTTSSIILYSRNTTGGTVGNVSIGAQSSGSFTLISDANETSTFNYLIIN